MTNPTTNLIITTLNATMDQGYDAPHHLGQVLAANGITPAPWDTDVLYTFQHLWERINVTETTALRFADATELTRDRIDATLERIAADARQDLEHLASTRLRGPLVTAS